MSLYKSYDTIIIRILETQRMTESLEFRGTIYQSITISSNETTRLIYWGHWTQYLRHMKPQYRTDAIACFALKCVLYLSLYNVLLVLFANRGSDGAAHHDSASRCRSAYTHTHTSANYHTKLMQNNLILAINLPKLLNNLVL